MMLNTLPAPILLDIAILFTALAWGLGAFLVDKKGTSSLRSQSVASFAYSVTASRAWAHRHGRWSRPQFLWTSCFCGTF